ncbi:MAG TPA: cytochrome c oxidase subunit II [Candidatus Limnocylindrales bacterium]|nr:cytochrome c oxidase subunit II [Candidatus Limnocylindrales bacterium]
MSAARRSRTLGTAVLAGALAVGVAACLPASPTSQGKAIGNLYLVFAWGGIFVAVLVWTLVTIAIIRGRRARGMPKQIVGNTVIESIWTGVPLLAVLGLFGLTLLTLNTVLARSPETGITVNVTAFRWQWQFDYPVDGVRVVGQIGNDPEMVVPVGEPVHVSLMSPARDVNHAFWVPQFLFKRDAIAGRTSDFDFTVEEAGTYRGQCAEFCGVYHDAMTFSVRAVSRPEYDAWVATHKSSQP